MNDTSPHTCPANNLFRAPKPQGIARAESQKAYDAALAAFQRAFQAEGAADEDALFSGYQVELGVSVRVEWGASLWKYHAWRCRWNECWCTHRHRQVVLASAVAFTGYCRSHTA